jgi:hypothetical protein
VCVGCGVRRLEFSDSRSFLVILFAVFYKNMVRSLRTLGGKEIIDYTLVVFFQKFNLLNFEKTSSSELVH